MLAACTLYYRTKQQIDKIREGKSEVIDFGSTDAAETKVNEVEVKEDKTDTTDEIPPTQTTATES